MGHLINYIIKADTGFIIHFAGEIVAKATSRKWRKSRWTELILYKTVNGNFIAHEIGKSLIQGEREKHRAEICTSDEEIINFFGTGRLAQRLYKNADVKLIKIVD